MFLELGQIGPNLGQKLPLHLFREASSSDFSTITLPCLVVGLGSILFLGQVLPHILLY